MNLSALAKVTADIKFYIDNTHAGHAPYKQMKLKMLHSHLEVITTPITSTNNAQTNHAIQRAYHMSYQLLNDQIFLKSRKRPGKAQQLIERCHAALGQTGSLYHIPITPAPIIIG